MTTVKYTAEETREILDITVAFDELAGRVKGRLTAEVKEGRRGWRACYGTMPGIGNSLLSFVRAEALGDRVAMERALLNLIGWVFVRWQRDFGSK